MDHVLSEEIVLRVCVGGISSSYGFICSRLLSFVYEDTKVQVNVTSEMKRSVSFRLSLGGGGFGDG